MGERLAEEVIFYIPPVLHQLDFSVRTGAGSSAPMIKLAVSKIGLQCPPSNWGNYDFFLCAHE
jgi:hypothetical protein